MAECFAVLIDTGSALDVVETQTATLVEPAALTEIVSDGLGTELEPGPTVFVECS